MFFIASVIDWGITSVALWPIVGWWSMAIASLITLFVVSIDQSIFISVDGGCKPKKWILAARGSLAVMQILFMGLALLVAISNNMVDRTIAEAQLRELRQYDGQIDSIRQEFVSWQSEQKRPIMELSETIVSERQLCQDEAAGSGVGRGGRKTTGIAGVGNATKACFANVAGMETRLQKMEEAYAKGHGAEEQARQKQDELRIAAIQNQRDEVEKFQKTGKQQTGMLDRFLTLVDEGKKIIHSNPGALVMVVGLEILFAWLLGNVFISKLTLEYDEYDAEFRKDKKLDQIAKERQVAEENFELERREQELALGKLRAGLDEEEIRQMEAEAEMLERRRQASERLESAKERAFPAKPKKKHRR